jgi:tetratricopeptide (TPR) repeat protein
MADPVAPHDREVAWEAAQEGAELIGEGRHDEAVLELERLIEREPNNEYAHFFLGCAHYEQGRYAKALPAYVKSLELAPGYVGAMLHLGHTLRMLGRHEQAIRLGGHVLRLRPDDPDALYLVGACHFARGDTAAATAHLERFLRTHPEVEAATEAHGMLQVLRGEIVPATSDEAPD